jgi:hypothetical protein
VILVALILLFFPPAWLIERQRAFEVLDAIIAAAASVLAIGHAPAAWRSIRLPSRTIPIEQVYVIGLFLIASSLAVIFGGLWAWRWLGKPDALADSAVALFSRWVISWGLELALFVNLSEDGRLTLNAFWRAAALATLASGIAGVLAFVSR